MARRPPAGAPGGGEQARILVCGMVAGVPGQGGASWAVLQYVAGFHDLGHDVWFVEPVDVATADQLDQALRYTEACMVQVGVGDRWGLVTVDGLVGPLADAGTDHHRFDLLLNIAGMLRDPDLLERADRRVYLDLDPLFTQLWHARDGVDMGFDGHTHYVTLTDRAGAVGSVIPDCGLTWIPTVPVVALDHWTGTGPPGPGAAITTVAHWRSYGSIYHEDRRFGQKAHSFRSIIDLPRRIAGASRVAPLRLALGIHEEETDDLKALNDNGWTIVDPATVVATPDDYRWFVQSSAAELGVAKEGYVVSDSGWFSDRSACYLAAGRPVLAQRTGFERRIPAGDGVLAWSTVDELAGCVDDLMSAPTAHQAAASAVAREQLDAEKVLTQLLDRVLT